MVIAGLINLETTVRIASFPLDYAPVRYPLNGVRSTVSGVGYNLALALHTLGQPVQLLSLVGADDAGALVRQSLIRAGLSDAHVLDGLSATPQSVILYDGTGRRQIHVDLKNAQDMAYPVERLRPAGLGAGLAVLCNVNFTRPLLREAARLGLWVATDVHTLGDLDDDYNRDYMAAAKILFMSDENLPTSPEDWARAVAGRYGNEIIVIGLGGQGALLYVRRDDFIGRFPAQAVRPVVNTIGAGDALFASFLAGYWPTRNPYRALRRALLFAGYKVGGTGAADGFLTADELEQHVKQFDAEAADG